MRSNARTYAAALVQALDGRSAKEAGEIALRFKELLKKRGQLKLAGQALREFAVQWQARGGARAVSVTASPLEEKARNALAETLKIAGYSLQEKIDPRVGAGLALFLGSDSLIDGTARGRFHKLSRQLFS